MPGPSPDPVADAILARIRELARAHGTTLPNDTGLTELLAALKLGDQIPVAPFAVAADLLFHLLAADQHPQAETAP